MQNGCKLLAVVVFMLVALSTAVQGGFVEALRVSEIASSTVILVSLVELTGHYASVVLSLPMQLL